MAIPTSCPLTIILDMVFPFFLFIMGMFGMWSAAPFKLVSLLLSFWYIRAGHSTTRYNRLRDCREYRLLCNSKNSVIACEMFYNLYKLEDKLLQQLHQGAFLQAHYHELLAIAAQ